MSNAEAEKRWPKIVDGLVSGNKEDDAVVKMLLALRAEGRKPEEIQRLAQEKGVDLVR